MLFLLTREESKSWPLSLDFRSRQRKNPSSVTFHKEILNRYFNLIYFYECRDLWSNKTNKIWYMKEFLRRLDWAYQYMSGWDPTKWAWICDTSYVLLWTSQCEKRGQPIGFCLIDSWLGILFKEPFFLFNTLNPLSWLSFEIRKITLTFEGLVTLTRIVIFIHLDFSISPIDRLVAMGQDNSLSLMEKHQ